MNAVLTCHPATPSRAVQGISATIERAADGALRLSYELTGNLDRVVVPAATASRFADELWRHTCFELFMRAASAEAYSEFNFSPSGEWAAYDFERYREGIRPRADAVFIDVQRSSRTLVLDALLPATVRANRTSCVAALSAVVEERDGCRSYWALAHATAKPDFHQPDAFVLELP